MQRTSDTKVSREIQELSLLFEISTKLSETLDLKRALKPILQLMADHMKMLRGTLTVLNRKTGEIVIEEAYGLQPEEKAKGKYRMGEGITGKVIETGKPAIVPRISVPFQLVAHPLHQSLQNRLQRHRRESQPFLQQ